MRGRRGSAAHGKRSALGRHSIDALIVEGAQNYGSFWPHFDHLVDPRGFGVSENRISESRDHEKSIPRIRFTLVWVVVGPFWSIRSFFAYFCSFFAIYTDFYYSHVREVYRVIHFWKARNKGFPKIYTCPMLKRTPWGTGGFQNRKIRFFRFFLLFARISTIRTDAKYAVLYIFEKRIKRAFRKYIHVLGFDVLPGVQEALNIEKCDFFDFSDYLHGFLLFARTPSMPCYTFLKSA